MLTGVGISVASIIGNCLSSFPFQISLKWLVLLAACAVNLPLIKHNKVRIHLMFAMFILLIYLFLPFAFLDSGGSNNNATGYTFLLLICITYLFIGWRRIFLVLSLIAMFMAMHAVEYYFPATVMVFSASKQFADRMIQIPMLLLAAFFIILQFAREYEKTNSKLNEYANMDALTGLFNRRMFNRAIEEAISSQTPAYLVLIDLDNFKQVNDVYGHSAGDQILQKLSSLLLEYFDCGRNTVSRWGGDEFAVIYYGDEEALAQLLKRVKKAFGVYASFYYKAAGAGVSASSVKISDSADRTLKQADFFLYLEKQKKHSS